MLQVKSSIINFFLLVLGIPLDFCLDADYKQSRFSKVSIKKSFKFVPNKQSSFYNLSFILLLTKVIFVSKKQDYKKDI